METKKGKTTPLTRLRNGGRVPDYGSGPTYLGQRIEEEILSSRRSAGVSSTQSRVLLAAIALFAERGYENCSLRAIASAVGVKAPTIYNYYASKEAILVAAIDFGMDDFFSYVLDAIDALPREQQFFVIIRRHIDYKIRHKIISRANDRLIDPQFGRIFLPDEEQNRIKRRLDDYRHRIYSLICDFVQPDARVDATIATLAIMNQCDRTAYWYQSSGTLKIEETVEQLLILTGRILGLKDDVILVDL